MEGLQLLKQENPADKVKQLFADQGPLCNSEGFYNHIGECWNDALQMIFLYSDGIKEIVQKKLAESEIDPQEVDRLMHPYVNQEVERVFKVKANNNNNNDISISSNVSLLSNSNNNNNNNNTNNKNTTNIQEAKRRINIITGIIKNMKQNETGIAVQLGYLYVDLAYDYLKTLQKRFHRHYLAESMRISEQDKVCSTEDARGSLALEKLKQISLLFRSGGKEGTLAGYFGKAVKEKNFTFKRNPKNINTLYEVGGDPVSRNNVTNIFTRFFLLPIVFKEYRNTHNFFGHRFIERETEKKYTINDNIVAIYCGIRLEKTGHAIAFYKCGGRSYLFDDNFGTIEFPWVDFFRLGLQTIGNKEKEIKKKWKKAYSLRYPDNKDDLIDLHYYFNGILTIRNEKDQILYKTENYPYIMKYLYEHTENKTKFPEEYTTYLWTGKEIKLSNLDSTYPFESTTSIALENGETVTVTFRLEKGKSVYITQFTTFDFEGTLPTYAKSSGIFFGSRILEYNVTVEEILFQEQIEKVKQGKAKIDDIFYKNEYTLLKLGIEKGDLQMVKTALEMGADIHKRIKEESPIFFAVTHDGIIDLEIAEYLLTHGADKDLNDNTNLAKGLTPLQGSILFNEEEDVVKNVTFLLEKGADPKKPSSLENVLPIEFAMFWNLFPVRDLLIEYGGGIHTCFTKKILKRRTGSDSLVMYWIRKKNVVKAANLSYCYRDMEMEIWDDLNYENMIGETAVKLALALWESEWTKKLLEALLKNGADANHIDRFGLTPLYVAIKLGKFEFLKILMDFGANPNLYYPPLGTPLDYAKRLKQQEIVDYIEDKIKYTRNKNKKYEKRSTTNTTKTRKVNKSKPLYKNNFVKQATRRALNKAQALAASNLLKKSNKTDDTKAKATV